MTNLKPFHITNRQSGADLGWRRLQRVDQGMFVHDIAPGDVHEDAGFLHHSQCLGVDQVVGLLAAGHRHDHEIRGHCFGHLYLPRGQAGVFDAGSVVEHHLHVKAMVAAPGDRLADPPEADDSKAFSADVGSQHLHRPPAIPTPGPQQPFPLPQPPGGHQDQADRDVRSGIRHRPGGVGNEDSGGLRGIGVDVIVTHPKVGKDPCARRGNISENIGLEAVAQSRQHGIVVAQGGAKLDC